MITLDQLDELRAQFRKLGDTEELEKIAVNIPLKSYDWTGKIPGYDLDDFIGSILGPKEEYEVNQRFFDGTGWMGPPLGEVYFLGWSSQLDLAIKLLDDLSSNLGWMLFRHSMGHYVCKIYSQVGLLEAGLGDTPAVAVCAAFCAHIDLERELTGEK